MPEIIIIAHNIRSTHNVGAILRSADGFGVNRIIFSGYTPYPTVSGDTRLPHIREKLSRQIQKASLGAEQTVPFSYHEEPPLSLLKNNGYRIVALEQDQKSIPIAHYDAPEKIAILIGEEVDGIAPELIAQCQDIIEIPMVGQKESFNVSVATGIALYALTTSK